MSYSVWPIVPGSGWGPIALGETLQSIKKILSDAKVAFEAMDESEIYLFGHTCCLFFEEGGERRLVQIAIGDESQTLNDEQIVGVPLDEALSITHLTNYDQTSWSTTDVYFDLFSETDRSDTKGKPQVVADTDLLDDCTLWLMELGVGLSLDEGRVDTLVLRRKELIPKSEIGPLTAAQMQILSDPEFGVKLADARTYSATSTNHTTRDWFGTISNVLLPFAIAFLGYLGWNFYSHWQAWNNATRVTGVVTQILPEEATFKEVVVAEYAVPGFGLKTANIQWTYSPVKEIGKEIELAYLPSDPDKAMTIVQARDEALLGGLPPRVFLVGVVIAGVIVNSATRRFTRKLYSPKRTSST
jgi:hypothetical protein